MAIDKFEDLPGIINELQDGGLEIHDVNEEPSTLILGTAKKGVSDRATEVIRAQETESRFGLDGNLIQGMYETLSGGAANTWVMRIGARSAILYGVGTDDMIINPTSIETILKDEDAHSVYSVRYVSPTTRGPNEVIGHLKVRNALGQIVYDNNPGGQTSDTGEVLPSGNLTGGTDIGLLGDPDDFVTFESTAKDEVSQEDTFAVAGQTPTAPTEYTLSQIPYR